MADVAAPPQGPEPMQGIITSVPLSAAAPEAVAPPEEPDNACETLYIQNLNEKIKTDGSIVTIYVNTTQRDVQQISFARTRSDAVVKKLDADNYEIHKTRRDEHKKKTRYTNPLKQKFRAKRMASEMDGVTAAPAPKRPNVQMPDEYLPPNKILFLQNLPESVTKEQLVGLFSQYPNLYEVRLIPTKKDIAFVEFMDEGSAGVAKDALHNYKLDGENKIKITFARK
ncbi:hypothetical protein C0989_005553 [Termitomyces sp. Mn162]|nr:hypothetical protein C0989_005553 [Termitomyces sp. Mn162]